MLFTDILSAAVLLIAIIDPFVTMAALLSLYNAEAFDIPRTVLEAAGIAGALMVLFILLGSSLLSFFQISLSAFKIGGGIIILLLGLQTVLGIELGNAGQKSTAAVIIGTPLITGPGVATTLILLKQTSGYLVSFAAAAIALITTLIFLLLSPRIEKILGRQLILIFSRVIGLFLTAYAAQLILSGIKAFF